MKNRVHIPSWHFGGRICEAGGNYSALHWHRIPHPACDVTSGSKVIISVQHSRIPSKFYGKTIKSEVDPRVSCHHNDITSSATPNIFPFFLLHYQTAVGNRKPTSPFMFVPGITTHTKLLLKILLFLLYAVFILFSKNLSCIGRWSRKWGVLLTWPQSFPRNI